jgi:transcriptional regulator with XRE-family HTH domain
MGLITYNSLKSLCKDRGIKLETVADEMGLTRNGLKKSFDNHSLTFENMAKLAKLLGVPFEFFDTVKHSGEIGNEAPASYSTAPEASNESELDFLKWLFNKRSKIHELIEKDQESKR